MRLAVLAQVGERAEGTGTQGAGVGLVPAVGAGVFGQPRRQNKALPAQGAAEGPGPAVQPLVIPQVGDLSETLPALRALRETQNNWWWKRSIVGHGDRSFREGDGERGASCDTG